jgi:hypothetical protein
MSVFPKNYNLRCAKIMMFGGGGGVSVSNQNIDP